MKQKQVVWELLIITAGIAICGVAIHFFLIPSHLSVGSICVPDALSSTNE